MCSLYWTSGKWVLRQFEGVTGRLFSTRCWGHYRGEEWQQLVVALGQVKGRWLSDWMSRIVSEEWARLGWCALRDRLGGGCEDEAGVVDVTEGEETQEIKLLGWLQHVGWFASPPTRYTWRGSWIRGSPAFVTNICLHHKLRLGILEAVPSSLFNTFPGAVVRYEVICYRLVWPRLLTCESLAFRPNDRVVLTFLLC